MLLPMTAYELSLSKLVQLQAHALSLIVIAVAARALDLSNSRTKTTTKKPSTSLMEKNSMVAPSALAWHVQKRTDHAATLVATTTVVATVAVHSVSAAGN